MHKIRIALLGAIIGLQASFSIQEIKAQEIYLEEFQWTINIPESYEKVDMESWAKIQGRGEDMIESTFGEEMINQAKTLFVFKKGKLNYIESNVQPYDTVVDGAYRETTQLVNEMLYITISNQFPDMKVDSTFSTLEVDGQEFNSFHIQVKLKEDLSLHMYLFSQLFGNRELSLNITYLDENEGQKLLKAWKSSRFGK
ncbi:MAG: hypothetical protein AAGD28_30565 [Bacteroidota bacterium]